MPLSDVLKREANRIIAKVGKGDFVVALNDRGRSYTSKGFAEQIERLLTGEKKRVCFIIGGAYGFHPSIIERADLTLSISPMTLPHEIARLVMVEQIYRAFTILKREPYSHF
jgi:23S rRNA (pseudouridine1915-N3)-methyltransferase